MTGFDFKCIATRAAIAALLIAAAATATQAGGRNAARSAPDVPPGFALADPGGSGGRNTPPRSREGTVVYQTSLHLKLCREDDSGRNDARGNDLATLKACPGPAVAELE